MQLRIQRLLLASENELALADIEKLTNVLSKKGVRTHLDRILKRLDQNLIALQEVITSTYFHHTLFDDVKPRR